GRDVFRVHLAGMIWNPGSEINRSNKGHAMFDDRLSSFRNLAISSALGREIEDDRTRRHALNHLLGNEYGRFFPRNDGGGNHHVAFLHDLPKQFALTAVKIFSLRPSVTLGILRVFRLNS